MICKSILQLLQELNKALCDPAPGIVRYLATIPGAVGTALDLFVERGFRNSLPKSLRFDCTDLHGTALQPLVWNISEIRIQSQTNPEDCMRDIVDGTLIICVAGLAVVDMILYDKGIVYFLQISMQSYVSHSTKMDHLFETNVPFRDECVASYYSSKAPASWKSRNIQPDVLNNALYI